MAYCNLHPYHSQNTGVCSYCVCDRLSRLSAPTQLTASRPKQRFLVSYSSGPPSSHSSCPASPTRRRHRRNASDVIGFIVSGSKVGLRKSRSITFVSRNRSAGGGGVAGGKKRGFWSTLMRSSAVKRTNEVLKHSRTVK